MISENIMTVEFDGNVYNVEAIKKAAYVFMDRFSANISTYEKKVLCSIRFPEGATKDDKDALVDDFYKEVLDQDLRQRVANETANYRNAILALAFSSTNFTQNE
jgi:His-Xaa-Ser system protein HxsD